MTQTTVTSLTATQQRIFFLEKVRKWGSSSSDAILDPRSTTFNTEGLEGFIAYRDEVNTAIIFGDPICPPEEILPLLHKFKEFCKATNKSMIFISVSDEIAQIIHENKICNVKIQFGSEMTIDPTNDPRKKEGVKGSLVRRKVRHALNDGVTIHEYTQPDTKLESQIEQVGSAWLAGRSGPQVHISTVRLFTDRLGKRWFYAKQNDKIVGVLVLHRLASREGWLLNHVMHSTESSNGIPEFLVVTALETLQKENCHYVTFGSVPSDKLLNIIGLGRVSTWIIDKIYTLVNRRLNLSGRQQFWLKFHPHSYSTYLMFNRGKLGIKELLALMRGMNVKF